ncbi:MAG: hypothetical protein ACO1OB_03150 [Archangium sp.]
MKWFFLAMVVATSAFAQVVPDREVQIIQSLYDTGKYAEAARRANESLSLANFSDAQRIRLHEIAGLSSFHLGDNKGAQTSFLSLLKVNPDYLLDPFAVPPAAIKVFEQVRKDNGDALNLVRQQIALRLEQDKRAAAERDRLAKEQEERQRRQELLNGKITERTIEKRSMIVNFLPFGAGQFQQGRVGAGAAFAVSEGVLAILSIVSFFAIESLFQDVNLTWEDRLGGPFTITVRQIPTERHVERDVWTGIKYGTGIAFYALWGVGAAEAIWNHQSEVVTERQVPITPAPPSARLRIYPTPGGLGAGVTIGF